MATSPSTANGTWDPVQLTFWLEEVPAKPSPLPDCGGDSTTREGNSPSSISNWLRVSSLSGSSGRTSPVSCLLTEDGRLEPSSGAWRNSGTGSRTEFWTLGTSEFPSGGGVSSSLQDVLETGEVAPKFYLSQRACQGILRRASRRGKALPPTLQQALEQVAGGTEATAPQP